MKCGWEQKCSCEGKPCKVAGPGMGGAAVDRDVLAVELDAQGHYSVSIFSALAWICAGGGRLGGGANREFDLDAITKRIRAAVCGIIASVVDV